MSDYSVLTPPRFLADLMGEVLGQHLQCYSVSVHSCPIQISIGTPEEPFHEGLFLDVNRSYGIHHHGKHWEIFRGTYATMGHAWGDNRDDDLVFEGDFETWARGEVLFLIRRCLGMRTFRMLQDIHSTMTDSQLEEVVTLCTSICEAHRRFALEDGSYLPPAEVTLWLLEARKSAPSAERKERLRERLRDMCGSLVDHSGYFPLLLQKNGLFTLIPETLREEIQALLLERVREDTREVIASYTQGNTRAFGAFKTAIESCERVFHEAACALLEEAGREAVSSEDIKPDHQRIQRLINEYNKLFAEFRAYSPKPKGADKRGQRLIELEAELNAYWAKGLQDDERKVWENMDPRAPSPSMEALHIQAINRAVNDGRFLSGGSSGYVGWLRNCERYDEAVKHVCADTRDVELCVLRHRAHPSSFECYINNGLGSFLDSKQEEHIPLGIEVINRLEKGIRFDDGNALYQIACVLARAGEIDRALDYAERSVNSGERTTQMAMDPDLASIVDHPRFQAWLAAERSSAA